MPIYDVIYKIKHNQPFALNEQWIRDLLCIENDCEIISITQITENNSDDIK